MDVEKAITRPKRVKRYADLVLWLLKDQWFVLAIGAVIVIASQIQVPTSQQAEKELVITYLAPALVFFITGCTLPTRVLVENYSKWKVHLFVQLQCFLMTSAISFGFVSAAASNPSFMDAGLLVGFIIGGCLPTTMSSNVVMTKQAHGNQALTVVETTIGNGISPFLSPVLVQMYLRADAWYTGFLPKAGSDDYSSIYRRVFKQLGLSIYVPMVIGQVIQHFFPLVTKKVFSEWKLSKLGSLALLTILWSTFDQAFASGAFKSVKPSNSVFVVFLNLMLITIWTLVSFVLSAPWLSKQDTIAVCYCVPAKSIAIGVPLSAVLFVGLTTEQQSKLQIPMVIFQCIQLSVASILTIPFRRWIRPEEDAEERNGVEDEVEAVQQSSPGRIEMDSVGESLATDMDQGAECKV